MAPRIMASLPLTSCLAMIQSPLGQCHFRCGGAGNGGPFINRDTARFRARVITETATVAAMSDVNGRMIAVAVEAFGQSQDTWRARCNAQPASFAFFRVHHHGAFVRSSIFQHEPSS